MFFTGSVFLSILKGANPFSCVSMNNQECKVRPEIANVNSKETVFFPFSIKISKRSGCCNTTNKFTWKIVCS